MLESKRLFDFCFFIYFFLSREIYYIVWTENIQKYQNFICEEQFKSKDSFRQFYSYCFQFMPCAE
jgi:hypothetical protein